MVCPVLPERQARRTPQALLVLLALGLFCSSPAWAHGAFGTTKPVLGGVLHLLTSPLSMAALLGLIVALAGISERLSLMAGLCAAAASAAAATAPMFSAHLAASTAPAAVAVIGLTSVLALKPSATGAVLLSLLAGLAAGQAADLDNPEWQGVAGIAGVVLFITLAALGASEDIARVLQSKQAWLKTALPIARRVVGSWVTAMGLLLTALALQGKPV